MVAFPPSSQADSDIRDLALAWQSLAQRGVPSAPIQAEKLLRNAVKQSPNDPAVLDALGYIEQKRGATHAAREFYQRAIAADPNSIDAASNLGVIEARAGHLNEAVKLWEGAFQRAPARSEIGMNIATVLCSAQQIDRARSVVLRVLEFNPDLDAGKKLLHRLNQTPPGCGP